MLRALILLAVPGIISAQESGLKITDVAKRHGLHGPVCKTNQIHIGDIAFLEWVNKGLTVGEDGRVSYSIGIEIFDANGKLVFSREPSKSTKLLPFGGTQAPAFFTSTVGLDTPPGKYKVKITVEDLLGKLRFLSKASFTREVEIIKTDFALLRTSLSYDSEGAIPAPAHGVLGQTMQLNAYVYGAGRDKDFNPNLKTTVRILEKGKEVGKPQTGVINKAAADEKLIPVAVGLSLDRVGTFAIELLVEDKVSGKSEKRTFDLTVHPLK